jgi:hypothetical protein
MQDLKVNTQFENTFSNHKILKKIQNDNIILNDKVRYENIR